VLNGVTRPLSYRVGGGLQRGNQVLPRRSWAIFNDCHQFVGVEGGKGFSLAASRAGLQSPQAPAGLFGRGSLRAALSCCCPARTTYLQQPRALQAASRSTADATTS
jgi:hypothetical protein